MDAGYDVEEGSSYGWLYGFQGMRLDTVTDDNLSFSREYDPGTGTWTSVDPTGLGPDENDYRFEGNEPVALNDATGLQPPPLGLLTVTERGPGSIPDRIIPGPGDLPPVVVNQWPSGSPTGTAEWADPSNLVPPWLSQLITPATVSPNFKPDPTLETLILDQTTGTWWV